MGKYICLCGVTHSDKETADLHVKMYEDLALAEGFPRHKTFKQHWQARFRNWFFNFHWPRFVRFVESYGAITKLLKRLKFSKKKD